MTEYIKREEAINLLWLFADESCASVVSDFEAILPSDVVEVRRGKWEWFGPYRGNSDGWIGTCSVCKKRMRFFEKNRCPSCGALMKDHEHETSLE